jgi:uncharacterized protein YegP (UPF0339 family)
MKSSNHPNDVNKPNQDGFRILFRKDEKYYFQFRDATGDPVLFSRRGYTTEKGCQNGIEALLRIIDSKDNYEVQKSKKGKYFFIIKSANHKEIARSAMFDTKKEMQEKVELVQGIQEDVPVYGAEEVTEKVTEEAVEKVTEQAAEKVTEQAAEKVTEQAAEKVTKQAAEKMTEKPAEKMKEQAAEKKEKKTEFVSVKKKKTPAVPTRSIPRSESAENMPRYKFSIIYYPDSKIWILKNDFSGHSQKLKNCDGRQIQRFLMESLPAEHQEKVEPKVAAPTVKSREPEKKKPRKKMPRKVEMSIQARDGSKIEEVTKRRKLQNVEVALAQMTEGQEGLFEGQVEAKSLQDNRKVVVGKVTKQRPTEGRFVIPIRMASNLKPGLYLFKANIYKEQKGKEKEEFYSSQVVELN